jgi:FHA domain
VTCPNGHESASTDYCDTCGAAMPAQDGQPGDTLAVPVLRPDAAPGGTRPAEEEQAPPSGQECPNCSTANTADALFCEACGYDFTTGTMPRAGVPSSGSGDARADGKSGGSIAPRLEGEAWVAELWIDPQWYAEQTSPDPLPSAGPPAVVPLENTSLLVGRESKSRDIHPDVDCGADNGVSRRHAQLTTDGTRWWVEDLGSSNGTYVAGAVEPLPKAPIEVGTKREVGPDDRIYVGSWTRLVIRKAAPGEVA